MDRRGDAALAERHSPDQVSRARDGIVPVAAPVPPPPSDTRRSPGRRLRAAIRRHRLLILAVALPSLISVLYFAFIAAPQFVSEAKFVVRSNSRTGALALGTALSGFVRAADDTFPVHDYILSRDAAARLASSAALRDALARPEADFLVRY